MLVVQRCNVAVQVIHTTFIHFSIYLGCSCFYIPQTFLMVCCIFVIPTNMVLDTKTIILLGIAAEILFFNHYCTFGYNFGSHLGLTYCKQSQTFLMVYIVFLIPTNMVLDTKIVISYCIAAEILFFKCIQYIQILFWQPYWIYIL